MCVCVCVYIIHIQIMRIINYIPLKSNVSVSYYYYLRRLRHVIVRFVYYVQGLARGTADDDDGDDIGRSVGAGITCVRVPCTAVAAAVTYRCVYRTRIVLLGRL